MKTKHVSSNPSLVQMKVCICGSRFSYFHIKVSYNALEEQEGIVGTKQIGSQVCEVNISLVHLVIKCWEILWRLKE